MIQLGYRDQNGNIQLVQAGTALPANTAPHRVFSAIATATGLNAGAWVSPWTTHSPPSGYNSFNLGLFADVPVNLVPRFVIPRWEMAFNTANAGSHRIAIYYGVWDADLQSWVSPVYTAAKFLRNAPFTGHHTGDWYPAGATQGLGSGQYLPSDTFNQFPVEVHPSVVNLAASVETYRLRFMMAMHNAHASENITGSWRAWFTLLCF